MTPPASRAVLGGRARVSSALGSVEASVEVSDEMMPGVVSLPHGWGHTAPGMQLSVAVQKPGVGINTLLGDRRDPLSGTSVLSGGPVQIVPV